MAISLTVSGIAIENVLLELPALPELRAPSGPKVPGFVY